MANIFSRGSRKYIRIFWKISLKIYSVFTQRSNLFYLLIVGARHEQLQRKAKLALEILLEEKKKWEDLGDTEKKEFKPKYDAKRLEDYGAKPDESFCKIWKMKMSYWNFL